MRNMLHVTPIDNTQYAADTSNHKEEERHKTLTSLYSCTYTELSQFLAQGPAQSSRSSLASAIFTDNETDVHTSPDTNDSTREETVLKAKAKQARLKHTLPRDRITPAKKLNQHTTYSVHMNSSHANYIK